MSATLFWAPSDQHGKSLPDELRRALERWFEGGSEQTLFAGDRPFVVGLRDGGVKGAQALLDALGKHEEIVLRLIY